MFRIADTEVSHWLTQPLRCRQCHWDIKTWLLQLLESSLPAHQKCYLIEQTLKASRIVVSTDNIYSENMQVTVQSISPSSFSTSFGSILLLLFGLLFLPHTAGPTTKLILWATHGLYNHKLENKLMRAWWPHLQYFFYKKKLNLGKLKKIVLTHRFYRNV